MRTFGAELVAPLLALNDSSSVSVKCCDVHTTSSCTTPHLFVNAAACDKYVCEESGEAATRMGHILC